MNNTAENNTSLTSFQKGLVASLTQEEKKSLAKEFSKGMIKLHNHSIKGEIDRNDLSSKINILNSAAKNATNSGSSFEAKSQIKHGDTITTITTKDAKSSESQTKLYLGLFALFAIVAIAYLIGK